MKAWRLHTSPIRKTRSSSSFASVVWSNGDRTVRITKAVYERVRSDPRQFVIFRDHVIPDVEQVVSDGDRFLIVAKREGTPADVAIQEDPRT